MGKFLDLDGRQFGRLKVVERIGTSKSGGNALWLCGCLCGQQASVSAPDLKSGHTQSCGCIQREITSIRSKTHGFCSAGKVSPTYRSWSSMKNRCLNQKNQAYDNYGGRGISICDRWHKFENFLEDMGESSPGLQIDRINNNGDYDKKNCRWVTSKINNRNRRDNCLIEYGGEKMCLSEWAERYEIHPNTLWMRLRQYGWTLAKALTTPVRLTQHKEKHQ